MLGASKQSRVQDLINVGWGVRLAANDTAMTQQQLRENWFIDLSQSIDYSPWGGLGVFTGGAVC